MKKISVLFMSAFVVVAAQAQTVIDTLTNSTLSQSYTLTPVLYSGSSTPDTTTAAFAPTANGLQVTGSSFNDIEQALFLQSTYSLTLGETLSVNVNYVAGGSQDFGLAISSTDTPPAASTNPLGNTRTSFSYAFIGIRTASWHVVSSGFDGATGLSTVQSQPGTGTTTSLFITESAPNTFQMGYDTTSVNGGAPTILTTYTFTNSSVGTAIGFYSDVRANGTMAGFSNLTITPAPEPSTLAMGGMGLASLLVIFRRKK
jgi:hypothetical protein